MTLKLNIILNSQSPFVTFRKCTLKYKISMRFTLRSTAKDYSSHMRSIKGYATHKSVSIRETTGLVRMLPGLVTLPLWGGTFGRQPTGVNVSHPMLPYPRRTPASPPGGYTPRGYGSVAYSCWKSGTAGEISMRTAAATLKGSILSVAKANTGQGSMRAKVALPLPPVCCANSLPSTRRVTLVSALPTWQGTRKGSRGYGSGGTVGCGKPATPLFTPKGVGFSSEQNDSYPTTTGGNAWAKKGSSNKSVNKKFIRFFKHWYFDMAPIYQGNKQLREHNHSSLLVLPSYNLGVAQSKNSEPVVDPPLAPLYPIMIVSAKDSAALHHASHAPTLKSALASQKVKEPARSRGFKFALGKNPVSKWGGFSSLVFLSHAEHSKGEDSVSSPYAECMRLPSHAMLPAVAGDQANRMHSAYELSFKPGKARLRPANTKLYLQNLLRGEWFLLKKVTGLKKYLTTFVNQGNDPTVRLTNKKLHARSLQAKTTNLNSILSFWLLSFVAFIIRLKLEKPDLNLFLGHYPFGVSDVADIIVPQNIPYAECMRLPYATHGNGLEASKIKVLSKTGDTPFFATCVHTPPAVLTASALLPPYATAGRYRKHTGGTTAALINGSPGPAGGTGMHGDLQHILLNARVKLLKQNNPIEPVMHPLVSTVGTLTNYTKHALHALSPLGVKRGRLDQHYCYSFCSISPMPHYSTILRMANHQYSKKLSQREYLLFNKNQEESRFKLAPIDLLVYKVSSLPTPNRVNTTHRNTTQTTKMYIKASYLLSNLVKAQAFNNGSCFSYLPPISKSTPHLHKESGAKKNLFKKRVHKNQISIKQTTVSNLIANGLATLSVPNVLVDKKEGLHFAKYNKVIHPLGALVSNGHPNVLGYTKLMKLKLPPPPYANAGRHRKHKMGNKTNVLEQTSLGVNGRLEIMGLNSDNLFGIRALSGGWSCFKLDSVKSHHPAAATPKGSILSVAKANPESNLLPLTPYVERILFISNPRRLGGVSQAPILKMHEQAPLIYSKGLVKEALHVFLLRAAHFFQTLLWDRNMYNVVWLKSLITKNVDLTFKNYLDDKSSLWSPIPLMISQVGGDGIKKSSSSLLLTPHSTHAPPTPLTPIPYATLPYPRGVYPPTVGRGEVGLRGKGWTSAQAKPGGLGQGSIRVRKNRLAFVEGEKVGNTKLLRSFMLLLNHKKFQAKKKLTPFSVKLELSFKEALSSKVGKRIFTVYETRKLEKQEYRAQKENLEIGATRQKKRKRFYPRPDWLRVRLYESLLTPPFTTKPNKVVAATRTEIMRQQKNASSFFSSSLFLDASIPVTIPTCVKVGGEGVEKRKTEKEKKTMEGFREKRSVPFHYGSANGWGGHKSSFLLPIPTSKGAMLDRDNLISNFQALFKFNPFVASGSRMLPWPVRRMHGADVHPSPLSPTSGSVAYGMGVRGVGWPSQVAYRSESKININQKVVSDSPHILNNNFFRVWFFNNFYNFDSSNFLEVDNLSMLRIFWCLNQTNMCSTTSFRDTKPNPEIWLNTFSDASLPYPTYGRGVYPPTVGRGEVALDAKKKVGETDIVFKGFTPFASRIRKMSATEVRSRFASSKVNANLSVLDSFSSKAWFQDNNNEKQASLHNGLQTYVTNNLNGGLSSFFHDPMVPPLKQGDKKQAQKKKKRKAAQANQEPHIEENPGFKNRDDIWWDQKSRELAENNKTKFLIRELAIKMRNLTHVFHYRGFLNHNKLNNIALLTLPLPPTVGSMGLPTVGGGTVSPAKVNTTNISAQLREISMVRMGLLKVLPQKEELVFNFTKYRQKQQKLNYLGFIPSSFEQPKAAKLPAKIRTHLKYENSILEKNIFPPSYLSSGLIKEYALETKKQTLEKKATFKFWWLKNTSFNALYAQRRVPNSEKIVDANTQKYKGLVTISRVMNKAEATTMLHVMHGRIAGKNLVSSHYSSPYCKNNEKTILPWLNPLSQPNPVVFSSARKNHTISSLNETFSWVVSATSNVTRPLPPYAMHRKHTGGTAAELGHSMHSMRTAALPLPGRSADKVAEHKGSENMYLEAILHPPIFLSLFSMATTVFFHFCCLIGLLSMSQVRCVIKFYFILFYKLSKSYIQLISSLYGSTFQYPLGFLEQHRLRHSYPKGYNAFLKYSKGLVLTNYFTLGYPQTCPTVPPYATAGRHRQHTGGRVSEARLTEACAILPASYPQLGGHMSNLLRSRLHVGSTNFEKLGTGSIKNRPWRPHNILVWLNKGAVFLVARIYPSYPTARRGMRSMGGNAMLPLAGCVKPTATPKGSILSVAKANTGSELFPARTSFDTGKTELALFKQFFIILWTSKQSIKGRPKQLFELQLQIQLLNAKNVISSIRNKSIKTTVTILQKSRFLFIKCAALLVFFFQHCFEAVLRFFEKPTEVSLDFFAYTFLVELYSDSLSIMPEVVDLTIWNWFQKTTGSLKTSLFFGNLLQRRFFCFFYILLNTLNQPDTALIRQQAKGSLFWDLWADLLIKTVASENQVDVSSLARLEEERTSLVDNLLFEAEVGQLPSLLYCFLPVWGTQHASLPQIREGLASGSLPYPLPGLATRMGRQPTVPPYAMHRQHTGGRGNATWIPASQAKPEGPSQGNIRAKVTYGLNTKFLHLTKIQHNFINSVNFPMVNPLEINTDSFDYANPKVTYCPTPYRVNKESKVVKRWGANQHVSYQQVGTDLFVDLNVSKSFSHVGGIKYYAGVQYPIGSLVCQIYTGLFETQAAKNVLVLGPASASTKTFDAKSLLIQALAGETEIRIIIDNAARYTLVNRGLAVGIRLLKEVFNAIALQTPCFFLLEDVHLIGDKRLLLISDSSDAKKILNNQMPLSNMDALEVHEKNQVMIQYSKQAVTHYKKPYRDSAEQSIATNQYCFDFFLGHKNKKNNIGKRVKGTSLASAIPITSISLNQSNSTNQKLKPKKLLNEISFEENAKEPEFILVPRINYSVRLKVALLAQHTLSNFSAKVDMITDLLVIIDNVRSNKGFVVFATTNRAHRLDPALRRPGRLDETIRVPFLPTASARWEILKSNMGAFFKSNFSPLDVKRSVCLDLIEFTNFSIQVNSSLILAPLPSFYPSSHTNWFGHPTPKGWTAALPLAGCAKPTATTKVHTGTVEEHKGSGQGSITFHASHAPTLASALPGMVKGVEQGLFEDQPLLMKLYPRSYTKRLGVTPTSNVGSKRTIKEGGGLTATIFTLKGLIGATPKSAAGVGYFSTFKKSKLDLVGNIRSERVKIMAYCKVAKKVIVNSTVAMESYKVNSRTTPYAECTRLPDVDLPSVYAKGNTLYWNSITSGKRMLPLPPYAMHRKHTGGTVAYGSGQEKTFITTEQNNPTSPPGGYTPRGYGSVAQPGIVPCMHSAYRLTGGSAAKQNAKDARSHFIDLEKSEGDWEIPQYSTEHNEVMITTIKRKLLDLFASKVAESFVCELFSVNQKHESQSLGRELVQPGRKSVGFFNALTLYGDRTSNDWKKASSLVKSFLQKRYMYNKNRIVNSLLCVANGSFVGEFKDEPTNPPHSVILAPSKRYENYKKIFALQEKKVFIKFSEKMKLHEQQKFQRNLYKLQHSKGDGDGLGPHTPSYLSAPTKMKTGQNHSNQANAGQTFRPGLAVTDPNTKESNINNSIEGHYSKLSSVSWYYNASIIKRHQFYLTNQWFNGQLAEHNAETVFLSDVDWRFTFIEELGDLSIDFPDADQLYNPRHRRWLLNTSSLSGGTASNWHTFYNYDQEISDHLVMQSFNTIYVLLDKNREQLDALSYKLIKIGFLKELHLVKLML